MMSIFQFHTRKFITKKSDFAQMCDNSRTQRRSTGCSIIRASVQQILSVIFNQKRKKIEKLMIIKKKFFVSKAAGFQKKRMISKIKNPSSLSPLYPSFIPAMIQAQCVFDIFERVLAYKANVFIFNLV